MQRYKPPQNNIQPPKKKLDTKKEIKIKAQVLAHEFASQLPPAEAPDPELDERMMLQFTRSRFSVGSTHLQGSLADRLKQALSPFKSQNQPTQAQDFQSGPAPEGLEAERSFRLLAPALQEHIMSIVNANPDDQALVEQIRTLINDELFRALSLGLQSAFVDTLIWNAEANLNFMLDFMRGKCFQTFLSDPNYTEEQKSFELSFVADLSVLANNNPDSILNDQKFKDLNGGTLNAIIEELNSHEGDRFLDAKYRQLLSSVDFVDMRTEYQQGLVSALSQYPKAKVSDILQFLRSSDFIKIYSEPDMVVDAFLDVVARSESAVINSYG
ncbi:MAG: hypothetical protein WAQ98_17155 [Blastocatellia bacterium]